MWKLFISVVLATATGAATPESISTPPDAGWRNVNRCGPNCLYVMLFMDGKKTEYATLIDRFHLTERGTSVSDLARVSGELGLPLTAIQASPQALPELPVPAIVHMQRPGDRGHFVLLLHVNRNGTFSTIECTRGDIAVMSPADFYDQWTGIALVRSRDWKLRTLDRWLIGSSSLLLAVSGVLLGRAWKAGRRRDAPQKAE